MNAGRDVVKRFIARPVLGPRRGGTQCAGTRGMVPMRSARTIVLLAARSGTQCGRAGRVRRGSGSDRSTRRRNIGGNGGITPQSATILLPSALYQMQASVVGNENIFAVKRSPELQRNNVEHNSVNTEVVVTYCRLRICWTSLFVKSDG